MSKDFLKEANDIANSKGGSCISEEYIHSKVKLKLKCKKGHTFEKYLYNLRNGGWCRICNNPNSLEVFQEIAKSKGGKCLSKSYEHSLKKLEFECSEKHRWKAIPGTIKNGSWCKICFSENRLTDINIYKCFAESKGGKYLEKDNISTNKISLWKCKEGHKFKACGNDVLNKNVWCKICNKIERNITYINNLLKLHKGECLSKNISMKTLKWRCKKGHEFKNTKYMAKAYWCRVCNKQKLTSLK